MTTRSGTRPKSEATASRAIAIPTASPPEAGIAMLITILIILAIIALVVWILNQLGV